MVKNRAVKKATRERMEATGEVYSVAAHHSRHREIKVTAFSGMLKDPLVESEFTGSWSLYQKHNRIPLRRQLEYRLHAKNTNMETNSEKERAEALIPYNYGWYPRAGFFKYDGWKQVSLVATEDGVTAREGAVAPWVAVWLGLGNNIFPDEENFMIWQVYPYTYGIYAIVTSAWSGDVAPLAEFGYRMNKTRPVYFHHIIHYMRGISEWLESNGIDVPEGFALPVDPKKPGVYNETFFGYESFESIIPVWKNLTQQKRIEFLSFLSDLLKSSRKAKEPANIIYSAYSDMPPVKPIPMSVGDRVKFRGIGIPMTVRGYSKNFVVLTMVDRKGKNRYSIVNWRGGELGAHDSWGYPVITDSDVTAVLDTLEARKLRVSPRNRIQLVIERVTAKKTV